MAISPWYVGQRLPIWSMSLQRDNGTSVDLTGVSGGSLALKLVNRSTAAVTTATGTPTIFAANPAIVQFAPSSADVTTAGSFSARLWVTWAGGIEVFDAGIWDILA